MNDLISRAEALHRLSYIAQKQTSTVKAVKAMLETLPSVQPEVLACGEGELSVQPETHEERTETHACDCISRQAALDAIWSHATKILESSDYDVFIQDIYKMVHRHIAELIEQLPSAQPKIIRCKDCKYCEHWYADKGRCFLWHEDGIDVFEEGFCNYAERRTE